MKETTLPISEAQREITNLPDRFTEELEATIVTRSGKKVMAILPYHTYQALLETIESLQETLEIVQDEEMMAAFRKGLEEIERGETVAWEDVEKELDKLNEVERSSEQFCKQPFTQHQRHSYQGTNPQAYKHASG
jgi:PHD/YefM family antitoxin component YafN of YafNO toxin-antitoxin module